MAAVETRDADMSDAEWKLRVDLAAAYRLVQQFGWDDLIFTHLSVRVPGAETHFLINPYGFAFEEITASSLVKIDLQGRPVEKTNYMVNPAGFTIHSAVHEARADAHCVIHLHTDQGMAVSAQADGLLPLTQTAMVVHDDLAYHDYEGIALNPDEKARIVSDLGTKNNLILRNHGTLTVGQSVPEAFLRMYFLERACKAQVMALGGGAKVHMPSDAAIRTSAEQARNGASAAAVLSWPALLRRLDRADPSYKT